MNVTGYYLDYMSSDLRYLSGNSIRSYITLNKPAQLLGLSIVYRASLAPTTTAQLFAAFSLKGKLLFFESVVSRSSSTSSSIPVALNTANDIVFDRIDFFITSSYAGSATFYIDNIGSLGTNNLKGIEDAVIDVQDSSNFDTTEIYASGAINTKSINAQRSFITEYNGQTLRLQGDIYSYGYVPLNPQLLQLASFTTPNTTNGASVRTNVVLTTRRN
jgi:hypothetical protein